MKLCYTLQGAAELNAVLAYIEGKSPQGAKRVQARIQAIMNMLLQYPGAGRLTGKRGKRRIGVPPYPYLIFYEATEDEIIIHGVRHAARRPSSMPE